MTLTLIITICHYRAETTPKPILTEMPSFRNSFDWKSILLLLLRVVIMKYFAIALFLLRFDVLHKYDTALNKQKHKAAQKLHNTIIHIHKIKQQQMNLYIAQQLGTQLIRSLTQI